MQTGLGFIVCIYNHEANPKSTLLHRRRRKWRPYDGHDKPLLNDIFNQLANKNIRVETRDGEPETLPKYHHQAQKIIYSISCYGEENPFVISVSDLSPDLITRLLDSRRKDYILYRVVERFIENCDSELLGANKKSRFERYPWLTEM
jgi:hypothetical protein